MSRRLGNWAKLERGAELRSGYRYNAICRCLDVAVAVNPQPQVRRHWSKVSRDRKFPQQLELRALHDLSQEGELRH